MSDFEVYCSGTGRTGSEPVYVVLRTVPPSGYLRTFVETSPTSSTRLLLCVCFLLLSFRTQTYVRPLLCPWVVVFLFLSRVLDQDRRLSGDQRGDF